MKPMDAFQLLRDLKATAKLRALTDAEFKQNDTALYLLLDKNLLVECGCCGGYHPKLARHFAPDPRFNGGAAECRSDLNRFY